jgi:hypothetical protein
VSTWFDASFNHDGSELTDEEWARHWQRCVQEASEAGVLLLFAQADERHTGALVELGSALASGAQVYLVAPHANWSVRHHPRCRSFDTLEDAIVAIMAMEQGASERERAGNGFDTAEHDGSGSAGVFGQERKPIKPAVF